MKIGIIGGTFNPVHYGHIAIAKTAYCQLNLDKVVFMPTGNPPHKKDIADGFHRLEMVKLAIDKINYFEVSDFEMRRAGVIYTADTLSLLTKQKPYNKYTFIIGGDSYNDIEKWYHPEIVMKLASIAVCIRGNESDNNLMIRKEYLEKTYDADINILNFDSINISSSEIRKCFQENSFEKIRDYIAPEVEKYILNNKLYQNK